MLQHYRNAKLILLLEAIRTDGRYGGFEGVNALTNAALGEAYNRAEVTRELRRAVSAGEVNDESFRPAFSHPKQGFSYGLNPYTDWSLAQLKASPTHYYLFLGLDWYSISSLTGHPDQWFDYLHNPFLTIAKDRYWRNVWAWILKKYSVKSAERPSWDTVEEREAAAFIRADGGAFIFHNLIPYLRPAGTKSADTDWYNSEWKKPSVRADIIEDLRILRSQAGNRIVAICTGQTSVDALVEAGYERQNIHSWKAHPSRVFHPSVFQKDDLWFKGRDYFVA
jgi:hypothetical protein